MEPLLSGTSPLTATLSPGARRAHARDIWQAGVAAVQPASCVPQALANLHAFPALSSFDRLLVVGGGKAGAAMSQAVEEHLPRIAFDLDRLTGWVNVPTESIVPLKRIHLHPARPSGINQPTPEAVRGTEEILRLVDAAGPRDLVLCLLSGGGSALLCAPVGSITLAEKQALTQLLHRCGAGIQEMNAVRKHLSRIKGGGLARRLFRHGIGQRRLWSLIISDVIGDPLDVIASGPTCVDPTTYADAWEVLERYGLLDQVPPSLRAHLERGMAGQEPETLKPESSLAIDRAIRHDVIASNRHALEAAADRARALGYEVIDLGDAIAGDTATFARETLARFVPPHPERACCVLSGGETTVALGSEQGRGGRNQEMALAYLVHADHHRLRHATLLCGGTDGEDGPTDAAGAFADGEILQRAQALGLHPADYLRRHDAYKFFEQAEGLLKTGLTNTNVMDLRVLLLYPVM